MITTNTSNHPEFGFKSKTTLAGINIPCLPFMGEAVVLTLSVNYFKEDDTPITIIPPRIVELKAGKDMMVDQNGQLVDNDSPEAVMSEYDFFMMLMNQPIKIAEIVVAKIQWADGLGRLHE